MVKSKKIEISLTDFIEFVNKVGGSKQTKVKEIKNRDDYEPQQDFYKPLRERIVEIHMNDLPKKELDKIISELKDDKKIKNYPDAISGYKKFWGRKKLIWFDPPTKHWTIGDLDVRINPELGLECNGNFFVIKLYFKADKLSKNEVDQILSLLENQLRGKVEEEIIFCVLDVRNSKLFENSTKDTSLLPLLRGEARSFEEIWYGI